MNQPAVAFAPVRVMPAPVPVVPAPVPVVPAPVRVIPAPVAVIPAQAGIQGRANTRAARVHWVPACAGTTA